jgi:hypothetical protein
MDGCAKYSLGCFNLCCVGVDTGLPAYADGEHVVKIFQSGVGTHELRMLYVAGENIVLPQHIFNENTLVEFSVFTPDGERYSPAFAGLAIPETNVFTFTTQKYPVIYA